MGDLAGRIAALPPEKQALIAQLLAAKGPSASEPQIVPQKRESDAFPLSFAQERLFFINQLDPNSPVYNVPVAVHLTGPLDLDALRRSFDEIVLRHEALRTTFHSLDGQPMQVIGPPRPVPLPVTDLRDLNKSAQQERVQQLIFTESRRPFDIARDLLLRALLVRTSDAHLLFINVHHIVFDGWSAGVLVRELAMLHDAFHRGEPSPLPGLPIQYVDYALWQRQWLQGEVLESQLAYWKRQLAGSFSELRLPYSRPKSAGPSFEGAKQYIVIPRSLSDALKALSQREGVTLFMTLLAALKTLLYRYTGQDDIIVGMTHANRERVAIRDLIGFFVNMLVLRTSLSGEISFRELLKRVKGVTAGAYAHPDLPFEQLVKAIQLERGPGNVPTVQVVLTLQNAPMEVPGIVVSHVTIDNGTAKFELVLNLVDTEQGLSGWMEYNTGLFDSAIIARMLAHYRAILEEVVAHPECMLVDIPLEQQEGSVSPAVSSVRLRDETEQFNFPS